MARIFGLNFPLRKTLIAEDGKSGVTGALLAEVAALLVLNRKCIPEVRKNATHATTVFVPDLGGNFDWKRLVSFSA